MVCISFPGDHFKHTNMLRLVGTPANKHVEIDVASIKSEEERETMSGNKRSIIEIEDASRNIA